MKNLFGDEDLDERIKQRGHAARPGTGPKGETCGTCQHYRRVLGGNRHYLKCGLMKHAWTGGPGSDIRAKDPACGYWRAK
jgi:hypothetical protein